MRTLDQSHAELVERVPAAHRRVVRNLPYRLGLSPHEPGSFSDYASLPPIIDLPRFVLKDEQEVPAAVLDRHRFAHHVGGFHGLARDRILDGQVERSRDLHAALEALLDVWVDAVADACGSRAAAARECASAMERFAWAAELEHRCIEARRMSIEQYVRLVAAKTSWLAVPARGLAHRIDPRRARAFERAFALLMLSLQTLDDAADIAEDVAHRGAQFPALLGVSPNAMLRASAFLARATARSAGTHLPELRDWAETRASEVLRLPLLGGGLADELQGATLAQWMCDRASVPAQERKPLDASHAAIAHQDAALGQRRPRATEP